MYKRRVKRIRTLWIVLVIAITSSISQAQEPMGSDKYPNGFKYITASKKNPGEKAVKFIKNFETKNLESNCERAKDIYDFTKTHIWNKVTEQSEGCTTNVFVSYSDYPLVQDIFIQGESKVRCTINEDLIAYAKQKCGDKPSRKLDMEFKITMKPDRTCIATMYENGVTNKANNGDHCDLYSYLLSNMALIDSEIEKMKN